MSGRAPIRVLVPFGLIPFWGNERDVVETIHAMVKEGGVECLFLTHDEWGHVHITPELDARGLAWQPVTYVGRFLHDRSPMTLLGEVVRLIRANLALIGIWWRFRPTHVHLSNTLMFFNFLPFLMLIRTPIVWRHGDQISRKHWFFRLLWWLIARRASEFVCVSHFVEAEIQKTFKFQVSTSIIYGIPPNRSNIIDLSLPKIDPLACRFIYVGRITEAKGVDILYEVFKEISRDNSLVICLAGDYSWNNKFADDLMEKISMNSLEDKIFFLGELKNVEQLYEWSNVHLAPSVGFEALGLVVMEAKRAARPSIVFPSGGLPEMITDGEDGFVCRDKSVAALTEACLRYVHDPDLAIRHGAAAQRSLSRFGLDSFGARWKAVYALHARDHA